jgi:hypothetical protein
LVCASAKVGKPANIMNANTVRFMFLIHLSSLQTRLNYEKFHVVARESRLSFQRKAS